MNLPEENDVFSQQLCGSIVHFLDQRNYPANQEYCRLMSVDQAFFEPENTSSSIPSQNDLIQMARDIAGMRSQKDIDDFLLKTENAFMNAARSEIIST